MKLLSKLRPVVSDDTLLGQEFDERAVLFLFVRRDSGAPSLRIGVHPNYLPSNVRDFLVEVLPAGVLPKSDPTAAIDAIPLNDAETAARAPLDGVVLPRTQALPHLSTRCIESIAHGSFMILPLSWCPQFRSDTAVAESVVVRPYGAISFRRGVAENGELEQRTTLRRYRGAFPVAAPEKIFPRKGERGEWFTRVSLPVHQSEVEATDLFIARASALPSGWQIGQNRTIWTSGPASWIALAKRGVWVHGCNDGLGEQELDNLEDILTSADREPASFIKLTHADSGEGSFEAYPTYRLEPLTESPDLTGRTHFFWSSGSSFLRALELYPEIVSGWHACGPGKTYRTICETLGGSDRVAIFLSVDAWRAAATAPTE